MMQALLLVASVFTIITSILSVQIPRYIQHQQQRNNAPLTSQHKSDEKRPMTDGTDSSSDNTISAPKPRKPWDPPFPTTPDRKEKGKGRGWLALPPMKRTEHDEPSGERVEDLLSNDTAPEIRISNEYTREKAKNQPKNSKEDAAPVMSIIWTTVAILAGMFLVLLFTILIAHCLAWFIVYKTEARLGEARKGLVQGGEMRLCLCARG
jgi:ABC-type multidrug transport system fused ATPase/permease subunit